MSRRTARRLGLLACAAVAASLLLVQLNNSAQGNASQRLSELFEEEWQARLEAEPMLATDIGDRRYDHRLPDATPAFHAARREALQGFLERLGAIPREELSPREQESYDIFARLLRDDLADLRFRTWLTPWNGASGFHTAFPQLAQRMPFDSVEAYERYVSRLEDFDRWTGEQIANLRTGLAEGRVLPRVILEGWQGQVEPHLVDDATDSVLYDPFESFPEAVPARQRQRLAEAGRRAIEESVIPAYRRLHRFLAEEYVPGARDTIAAGALPDGEAFYRQQVAHYTTLDWTPEEIHQKGLEEVARIRREMEAIIRQVEFEGSFDDFLEFLRTDPQFYAETPEQLLQEVSWVLKRMDGQLPRLFGRLPRTPYGVKPVPDFLAPKIYTAYYEAPAGDGSRAGFYAVNTYNLPSRPLYEIEALSFHEAVPGHHLQIALQQEIEGLPAFRRFRRFDAFQEGWALYSERLGLEVGFYQDPYRNFGRLTYEMWRALRLVVDTGMHALGWSRQQAIDLMAENSALSLHNITTEVDRYIGWPGQALAYKTGELAIRELRAKAEKELGDDFDLRAFHDVVLGSGAVPLTVLEANVEAWMAGQGD